MTKGMWECENCGKEWPSPMIAAECCDSHYDRGRD